tara:strand:+ start:5094 stop:5483 length:390 start_codon:yes stop_codon:yes gene_type:complete
LKIQAEISVGELFDKITILNIKLKKINDPNKLLNVKTELDILMEQSKKIILNNKEKFNKLVKKLEDINEKLWDIENIKRQCEANKDFGDTFIKISRDVHFKNDLRASIKKEINLLSNSRITEEKEYSKY